MIALRSALRAAALRGVVAFALCAAALAQSAPPPVAVIIPGTGTAMRDADSIARIVASVQGVGFTAIVPMARDQGDAFYRSRVEPRAENIMAGLGDPLATIIDACREDPPEGQKLNVVAGVNVLLVHRGATLPPPGHVAAEHPDWLMADPTGSTEVREDDILHLFLDPGIIEARQHITAVLADLVSRYELDGLYLDQLRYPTQGTRWGFGEMALEQYHLQAGDVGTPQPEDDAFAAWRRDQLTQMLREIRETVEARRPGLPIWVGVEAAGDIGLGFESTDAYRQSLQDWPRWIDEELCDGVVLKIFRDGRTQEGPAEFNAWHDFLRSFAGRIPLLVGVSGQLNYRNNLFAQIRQVRAGGDMGLLLYDCDRPARDAGETFFTDLQNAALQERRAEEPASGEVAAPPPPSPEIEGLMLETPPTSAEAMAPPPMEMPQMPPPGVMPDDFLATELGEPTESEAASTDVSDFLPPPDVAPSEPLGQEEPAPDFFAEPEPTPEPEPPREVGIFEELPPANVPRPQSGAPAVSASDLITLVDGRQISGTVVEDQPAQIAVRLESGSIVRLSRDQVQSIEPAPR